MIFTIENATLETAGKQIKQNLREDYKTYEMLYKGDHFREGDGWVGPKPDPSDLKGDPNSMEIIQKFNSRIRRQFVSKNVVREVVTRHVNGVLSRKADIGISIDADEQKELSDKQQNEIDEVKGHVRKWTKDKDVMKKMRKALSKALYGGRAVIRFFIPNGLADKDGTIETPQDLEGALENIYIDIIDPDDATVYENPKTKQKVGIYKYKDIEDVQQIELSWVDEAGLTHLRVTDGDNNEEGEPHQLGGRLFHYELTREAIISQQVKQLQDLLNKDLTMWSANLDWSAFTERMILNGMPPGRWEIDKQSNAMEYQEEGKMKTGPNQTQYVFGQPIFNDEGQVTGMTNPEVVFREPIDVETFNATLGASYVSILEECKQAHILLNSESTPSGVSRREARKDYENDLKNSKSEVDECGAWVLETALALGLDLMGKMSEDGLPYDVTFNTILQVGALTKEEMDILIRQVDNKLISVETAMRKLGVDDVEAEIQRIDRVSEHMREIIGVMNEMGVISGTLFKKIVGLLISDKKEFFDDLDEDTVLSEIEESAQQQSQQNAFLGGFNEEGVTED